MKHIALLLTALTLAFSATAAVAKEGTRDATRLAKYEAHAGTPVKNFPYRDPVGWEVVDDEHILLTVRPKEVYLMRVTGLCIKNHRGAPAMAISSQAGRVSAGFDRITTGERMSCRIEEIRPVDMAALKKEDDAKDADKASS